MQYEITRKPSTRQKKTLFIQCLPVAINGRRDNYPEMEAMHVHWEGYGDKQRSAMGYQQYEDGS